MPIQSPNVIGFSSDFYGGDGATAGRQESGDVQRRPMTIVPAAADDVWSLELLRRMVRYR